MFNLSFILFSPFIKISLHPFLVFAFFATVTFLSFVHSPSPLSFLRYPLPSLPICLSFTHFPSLSFPLLLSLLLTLSFTLCFSLFPSFSFPLSLSFSAYLSISLSPSFIISPFLILPYLSVPLSPSHALIPSLFASLSLLLSLIPCLSFPLLLTSFSS